MSQGIIAFWAYSEARIPAGWHICDGQEETIDLRNQFVVGAGDTFAVGAQGGSRQHDHSFTADGHTHDRSIWRQVHLAATEVGIDPYNLTGITEFNTPGFPPWYGLIPIQKL